MLSVCGGLKPMSQKRDMGHPECGIDGVRASHPFVRCREGWAPVIVVELSGLFWGGWVWRQGEESGSLRECPPSRR
jgi:hypothetical protein